jgi:hypothetical protein
MNYAMDWRANDIRPYGTNFPSVAPQSRRSHIKATKKPSGFIV